MGQLRWVSRQFVALLAVGGMVAAGLAGMLAATVQPAAADGAGAEMQMPFTGWWDRFSIAHPSYHGPSGNTYADWAVDIYQAPGTAVRPRFRGPQLAMKVASVGATCGSAGQTVVLDIHTNNQWVGTARYGHLANVQVSPNEWIAPDRVIGFLNQYSYQGGCWEVSNTNGVHTHVTGYNLRGYSCYHDPGSGSYLGEGHPIGIVGGNYAGAAKSPCNGTIPPDNPDRDGDGIPDSSDQCPDQPGPAEHGGCPNSDGDGLRDAHDRCPSQPGPNETGGCPVAAECGAPTGHFCAEYYNSTNLNPSSRVHSGPEGYVDHNWGTGTPTAGISGDNFSVRWKGRFPFAGGDYDFTYNSDDDFRLYVDGVQLAGVGCCGERTSRHAVSAGEHEVKVEFVEYSGGAYAHLRWACLPGVGQYCAEYFANPTLGRHPLLSRMEQAIVHDWADGGPGFGLPADGFSARWTGVFTFTDGVYDFASYSDDGIRVWVDGQNVIDQWNDTSLNETGSVPIAAGEHVVRVDYFENLGNARIEVDFRCQASPTHRICPTLPGASVADAAGVEPDAGQTVPVQVPVSLVRPNDTAVSVSYRTVDGTALAGRDYNAATGSVRFAAGETGPKMITVGVRGDGVYEGDEAFGIQLESPVNAVLEDATGVVTITEDEVRPAVSVRDVRIAEGATGTATVVLSGASVEQVRVGWATGDGSAVAPADYTPASGEVVFEPGQVSRTVPVVVRQDVLDEIDERFAVRLASPVAATLGDATGDVIVTDDDVSPRVSVIDARGIEGGSAVRVPVRLSAPSGRTVSVQLGVVSGTATVPDDLGAQLQTVTFPAGATTATAVIRLVDDALVEPEESAGVQLSALTGAVAGDVEGVLAVEDDDGPSRVSLGDARVTEVADTAVVVAVPVRLSHAATEPVTVGFATADGRAVGGADYATRTGQVTIPAGQLTATISVAVRPDTTDEPDEVFYVDVTSVTNGEAADRRAAVTIVDDDGPPRVSVVDASTIERGVAARVAVRLSAVSGHEVTVLLSTASGTAQVPGDLAALNRHVVRFAPGELQKIVAVAAVDDAEAEPTEQARTLLSTPVNATLGRAEGVVLVEDDDTPPRIRVSDLRVDEPVDAAATVSVNVTLSHAWAQPTSVQVATADVTATAGADYAARSVTVTFPAGVTSRPVALSVRTDTTDEPEETFAVLLSNPVEGVIADGRGVVTIADDDGPPRVSVGDARVFEGGTAQVPVRLSAPSGHEVRVTVTTAAGTAAVPDDVAAVSTVVRFAPGQVLRYAAVPATDDAAVEPQERARVLLSGPVNVLLGRVEGLLVVDDDDGPPAISAADVAVTEPAAGATTTALVTVRLNHDSAQTVTVEWTTADGTAVAPADYASRSGTISFAPGETAKTVAIGIKPDTLAEAAETFTVRLSSPINATIGRTSATVTIANRAAG